MLFPKTNLPENEATSPWSFSHFIEKKVYLHTHTNTKSHYWALLCVKVSKAPNKGIQEKTGLEEDSFHD